MAGMASAGETHYRTCTLCEAMCGLAIEVDGRAHSLHPRRRATTRSAAATSAPRRSRSRTSTRTPTACAGRCAARRPDWEEIGWDEALDEAAERLRRGPARARPRRGRRLPGQPDRAQLRRHAATAQALRARAGHAAAASPPPRSTSCRTCWRRCLMFGHQLLLPVPDLDRTDYFLILGANPLASNGSLMTAPGHRAAPEGDPRARRPVVVVDPRRTETAALADRHLFIRPAPTRCCCSRCSTRSSPRTSRGPGRLAAVRRRPRRRARRGRARSRPSAWPRRTGIAADDDPRARARVRRRRRPPSATAASASAPRSSAAWPAGSSTSLNIVTGNLDRAGRRDVHAARRRPRRAWPGASASAATSDAAEPRARAARVRRRVAGRRSWPRRSRRRGRGRSARSSPSPATRCSRRRTARGSTRALAGLDFMVSIDLYLNETTRHAHLILPPDRRRSSATTTTSSSTLLAVRNTAKYSPALFAAPPADARTTGRSCSSSRARIEARARRQSAASRADARAAAAGSARAACSTCCCAPARTAAARARGDAA